MDYIILSSLLILVMTSTTNGQRTPTVSFISQNISTTRSATIDMDCSVLYATEYPVLWMKIGKDNRPIPLSSGSSLIIRDNRFALRYDTASATYTLQLKDVQRSDEGRYECQIIVGLNNKVTDDLYLRVQEPPVINDNSSRSVIVDQFESATLECTAKGSPQPKIEWRRENNAVLPTGGIIYKGVKLKIHSVKKEDRGTYFCVAYNGVGKNAKRHVALDVEFAPSFIDDNRKQVVRQAFNYEVGLVCSVEAYPPASITWIHNGVQRGVNDENYSIYKSPGADGLTTSNLKIRRLQGNQLGNYTCRAGNKRGQAETNFRVERSWDVNCDVGSCSLYGTATRTVQLTSVTCITSLIVVLFGQVI